MTLSQAINQISKINITGQQYTTTTFNTEGTPHHNKEKYVKNAFIQRN